MGRRCRNSRHPFRFVLRDQRIRLLYTTVYFTTRSVCGSPTYIDCRFQRGVTGNLPLPPQSVLHLYFFLNIRRYRGPRVFLRRSLVVEADRAFNTALEGFSTHISIAISLWNFVLKGVCFRGSGSWSSQCT